MDCGESLPYGLPTTPMRDWPDHELVRGILASNEGCFEVVYERYRRRIYAFALKRLGDAVEAEDVTQDVFLQVHRSLGSYQGRSALLVWMFGIARNQVCRRFRRKTLALVPLDDVDALELASRACPPDRQADAVRVLRRCIHVAERELSADQRNAFYLKHSENRSTRSIAEQLGKSTTAVKINLFRSRKTLVRYMPNVAAV